MSSIVECPHCLVTVLPSAENVCPSCNHVVSELPKVIREKISSNEEARMIRSIQMSYNARRILLVVAVLSAVSAILKYMTQNEVNWQAIVLLLLIALVFPIEKYRVARLRDRLTRTTSR